MSRSKKPHYDADAYLTRRDFLYGTSASIGSIALSSMLAKEAAAAGPLAPKMPHFAGKAKACIFLMMAGGPSHIDTFDPKPKLDQLHMQQFTRNDKFISAMANGSRDRYFQGHVEQPGKLVPEGIEGRVPYRGGLSNSVQQLLGGLRSGMGYCGAADLGELRAKARFLKISPAGLQESHVHDVIITKEAPNYSVE